MTRKKLIMIGSILAMVFSTMAVAQTSFTHRADVKSFIKEMHDKYHFDEKKLTELFQQAKVRPRVIQHMNAPLEKKPWDIYQTVFITPEKIQNGVTFWHDYRTTLARAEKTYGIPPEIIVAIIGVESNYGTHLGEYRVFDTLATFAFNYPNRAEFFKKELREFLLLCREKNIQPLSVYGSYAGAIGQPQFMPSSFRAYAVDFSHDKHIDLTHNIQDVIGSIANYLNANGWQPADKTIAIQLNLNKKDKRFFPNLTDSANVSLEKLKKFGIFTKNPPSLNAENSLIQLKNKKGYEYWLGLHNFYVITRYNASPNYAMAIYQLGEKISATYHKK